MEDGFVQIIVYAIIIFIWLFFGGSNKKKAPAPKPQKPATAQVGEGQPTLADLLKKLQQGATLKKDIESQSSEINTQLSKNYYQSSKPSELVKDQHLQPYKKRKKHVLVEDLLKDKKTIRKAFIMGEIFKTKF